MKRLPNGVDIVNATPHSITFWAEGWSDVVQVPSHMVLNAEAHEVTVDEITTDLGKKVSLVRTEFRATQEGLDLLNDVPSHSRTFVVGSIIAAQAYPGRVYAMTPAPGYERVPPTEKRMSPDKFTVF